MGAIAEPYTQIRCVECVEDPECLGAENFPDERGNAGLANGYAIEFRRGVRKVVWFQGFLEEV